MDEDTAKNAEANPVLTEGGRGATISMESWLAWRRAAGKHIDPETAEVTWWYARTLDPYGVCANLPEECDQVGREYFARSPDCDLWISFGDLPEATQKALWEKHRSRLAFPAGLPIANGSTKGLARRLVYSVSEACAIAGIRRTSLYKAIRAGQLCAIKIGRRTLIAAADLHRWLDDMPTIVPKAPAKSESDVPSGTP